jgi:hypothetical protein
MEKNESNVSQSKIDNWCTLHQTNLDFWLSYQRYENFVNSKSNNWKNPSVPVDPYYIDYNYFDKLLSLYPEDYLQIYYLKDKCSVMGMSFKEGLLMIIEVYNSTLETQNKIKFDNASGMYDLNFPIGKVIEDWLKHECF